MKGNQTLRIPAYYWFYALCFLQRRQINDAEN